MIETVFDYLLILWALPSLVTALLVIRCARKDYYHPLEPSEYDFEEWGIFLAISLLYPIGLWIVFMEWLDETHRKR